MIYYLKNNPYFTKINTQSCKFLEVYRSPKRLPDTGNTFTSGVDIWFHRQHLIYVVIFWDLESEEPDIIAVTDNVKDILSRVNTTYLSFSGYHQKLLEKEGYTFRWE